MGLIEKISKKTMKWVIKRKGFDMCEMCDDSIATESMRLCKDCSQEMLMIEMHQFHLDELEAMR